MVSLEELVGKDALKPSAIWQQFLKNEVGLETAKNYNRYFNKFLVWFSSEFEKEISAVDLFQLHAEAYTKAKDNPTLLSWLPQMVKKWRNSLVESGASNGTAANHVKAVRAFFRVNNLELIVKSKKVRSQGQRMITIEEINEAWDTPGNEKERNRAIMTTLKDTGLRVSDLVGAEKENGFTLDKFLTLSEGGTAKVYYNDDGEEFRVFRDPYKTKKSGINAYVHFGPESIDAIKKYVRERKSGAVFLTYEGAPMKRQNLTTVFRDLCQRLSTYDGRLSAHSFRKFHWTMMENATIPNNIENQNRLAGNYPYLLQGREIPDSSSHYTHAFQSGDLTTAYIANYDRLRVFTKENQAFKDMQIEFQKKDEQYAELKAHINQLEQLMTKGDDYGRKPVWMTPDQRMREANTVGGIRGKVFDAAFSAGLSEEELGLVMEKTMEGFREALKELAKDKKQVINES